MVFLKSVLAGIAAVILAVFAVPLGILAYSWFHQPSAGVDVPSVSWDPISVTKSPTVFLVIGIFLAGFVLEFMHATRK